MKRWKVGKYLLRNENKQDMTVNKVSSLRDLVQGANSLYRRLRYASPTVNKVLPLQGFAPKSRRDSTLLTVGEAEGATYGAEAAFACKSRRDDTLLTEGATCGSDLSNRHCDKSQ
jgi:hypothetical protein